MRDDAAGDLARWIPRLIAAWRKRRAAANRKGPRGPQPQLPDGELTPGELREVAGGVKALSHGLTRERKLAGARYMDDPALLGAYLLFYWPVSYAQARATLSELPSRPRQVLDLGAGPGPLAFAALDAGASEATAADRSRPALELARALAIEASEGLATRDWSPERPLPDGTFDLITMGHVVNELFDGDVPRRAALVESILARLTPNGSLLILEPALRETSRALLGLRDVLVAKGYAVRAPCLYRGNCPALVKESDWCHAERTWRLPPLTEALARAASIHKESLKMSYLILAPRGVAWAEPPSGDVFRIVSEFLEGKGRQRVMGCGPSGRVGLALQDRLVSERNRLFTKMQRGDVVRVTGTEPKGDGLSLGAESTLDIIAHAGKPVSSSQGKSEGQ